MSHAEVDRLQVVQKITAKQITQAVEQISTIGSILDVIADFLKIFFGGGLIGLFVGLLFGVLQKGIKQPLLTGVMSLVVAYGSFILAEHFMVSGIMSTLLAALSFSMLRTQDQITYET